MDFAFMQRMRRFAKYWDLVGNSGNFVETTPLIWAGNKSPFFSFLQWSDWLYSKISRTDTIALARLSELFSDSSLRNKTKMPSRSRNVYGVITSAAAAAKNPNSCVPTFRKKHRDIQAGQRPEARNASQGTWAWGEPLCLTLP
jgi:hypothetical protein